MRTLTQVGGTTSHEPIQRNVFRCIRTAGPSRSLGVIAENIANVNTVGYKANSVQFSTIVTGSPDGGSTTSSGVQAVTTNQIENQGLLQSTESATDISIAGEGFFAVNNLVEGGQVFTGTIQKSNGE